MESKKTFHLLALIFSLLIIEISMASRILAEYNPPPDNDGSRIGVSGSLPEKDGSWIGGGVDQGMVLVPPPATETNVSPTNNNVDVSTTVSPTGTFTESSVTSSSGTSSTRVSSSTSGASVTSSSSTSSTRVSSSTSGASVTSGSIESESATYTDYP